MGLAYSFGNARALVNRYAAARVALAAAQRRLEMLAVLDPSAPELQVGTTHADDVVVDGTPVAHESWSVAAYDDPANGTAAGPTDLKLVTVTVSWGASAPDQQVQLSRFFPAR